MNKKNNRKGFTIVELVIVIAVIAILATVLVPTFSGIVEKAQTSAAIQEARNIYTSYIIEYGDDGAFEDDILVKTSKGKYVQVTDGTVASSTTKEPTNCTKYYYEENGEVKSGYVGDTHTKGADNKCTVCGTDVSE